MNRDGIIVLPVGTLSTLKSSRSKFPVTIDYNILESEEEYIIIKKKYFEGRISEGRILYQSKLFNY